MAQTGFTPIQLYYSTTPAAAPAAVDLNSGELAINTADEKLYFKNASGSVKLLASNASSTGTVSSVSATVPSFLSISGSPITESGTLAISYSGTALPIANGGTGLTAAGSSGNILTSNGSVWQSTAPQVTLSGSETLTNKTLTSPVLTSPALGTPASGNLGSCTVDGVNDVGFRSVPQNSQSSAYTLVLSDSGKHIFHPSSDANPRTYTIPANSSVSYPIGTALTFINMATQNVTIAINSDTLTLSASGLTGSRTLAQYGSATAIKISSTAWLISGSGLT